MMLVLVKIRAAREKERRSAAGSARSGSGVRKGQSDSRRDEGTTGRHPVDSGIIEVISSVKNESARGHDR